jgi:hypothetical protein
MAQPPAVDPLNHVFARVMETVTWIGLAAMLLFGALYILGINPAVSGAECAAHWHLPADQYWKTTAGTVPNGYAWFLGDLTRTDNLAVFGVVVLAMAPVLSVLASIGRARGLCRALLVVLLLEFGFAIFRPFLLGGGGH